MRIDGKKLLVVKLELVVGNHKLMQVSLPRSMNNLIAINCRLHFPKRLWFDRNAHLRNRIKYTLGACACVLTYVYIYIFVSLSKWKCIMQTPGHYLTKSDNKYCMDCFVNWTLAAAGCCHSSTSASSLVLLLDSLGRLFLFCSCCECLGNRFRI